MNPASFWTSLPRPILGLSPMDGVTDQPFRHIVKKYGQPALVYTEFTSVEGVCHGATQLLRDFLFDETQRPVIAQIYGTTPDFFRQTAILLCEMGFDGIDINMGCPAKNVAHSGAGAALIRTPELAQEIIRATQTGVSQWQQGITLTHLPNVTEEIWQETQRRKSLLPLTYQQKRVVPVSVKTRVGYDSKIVSEWIPRLLEMNLSAIALHGRTLKQQYGGLADWDEIAKAAEIIHQTDTLILGNGDVKTYADAMERIETYGVDGILIGRASMGNPFVFQAPNEAMSELIFPLALEHCRLYEATYEHDEKYHFLPMRKHLGWYVKDIPNASQIRIEVFKAGNTAEVEQVFRAYGLIQ